MLSFIQRNKNKLLASKAKVIASLALIGATSAVIGSGVYASFTDSTNAGAQTISSGSILLAVGPTNDTSTAASNIAAGDTVAREVDLNSTGASIADSAITLGFTASPSNLLTSDATNGLQLSISSCSVAWTRTTPGTPPVAYTCGGTTTPILIGGASTSSVSSLIATPAALTTLKSLSPNKQDYLVFTFTLPSSAPGDLSQLAACSGVAAGTAATEDLQGCSTALTYNFVATQRTATAQ